MSYAWIFYGNMDTQKRHFLSRFFSFLLFEKDPFQFMKDFRPGCFSFSSRNPFLPSNILWYFIHVNCTGKNTMYTSTNYVYFRAQKVAIISPLSKSFIIRIPLMRFSFKITTHWTKKHKKEKKNENIFFLVFLLINPWKSRYYYHLV